MTLNGRDRDAWMRRILIYEEVGEAEEAPPTTPTDGRQPDSPEAGDFEVPLTELISREAKPVTAAHDSAAATDADRVEGTWPRGDVPSRLESLRRAVHGEVVTILKQRGSVGGGDSMHDAAREIALELLKSETRQPLTQSEREDIASSIAEDIDGLGPIQYLLDDPRVGEIMVNGPHNVYFEVAGRLQRSSRRFQDDDHVMRVVERMLLRLGRRVDEQSPMVDARLPDGSRVHVVIPPLVIDGPTITIRKFSRTPFTSEDLIRMETISVAVARFLEACVGARLNIMVSGGTGSGKTTFLSVLSTYIPDNQRLVTIEDPAELQLRQPHVVRLETRPSNLLGKGEITQRELLRNALRMRPDRIIVGEVRSGEAFDMLQAMNTGHEGSLTTVHANSPRDALARVENMVLMAGLDLPPRAIREQIASAIHIVVQLARLPNGARRVTQVSEITGMESGTVTMQDLFVYQHSGTTEDGRVQGALVATGLVPQARERLENEGYPLDPALFQPPDDEEPSRW